MVTSSRLAVVAQLGLHRALVDAVEALAEPYRSAVWLRYFEDLPPRRIAARLGLSEKTIEFHRSKVMRKMDAGSLAELTRKVVLAGAGEAPR